MSYERNTMRWNGTTHGESPKVDAFLAEVRAVCERHGMAISHEDGQGAFEIVSLNEEVLAWLWAAHDCTGAK